MSSRELIWKLRRDQVEPIRRADRSQDQEMQVIATNRANRQPALKLQLKRQLPRQIRRPVNGLLPRRFLLPVEEKPSEVAKLVRTPSLAILLEKSLPRGKREIPVEPNGAFGEMHSGSPASLFKLVSGS